ncbi:MAG: dihydroxyacid dehydratase/phosphogluconate dehydratase [Pseudomonadota bacterium]
MHPVLTEVTERIQARSAGLRQAYVAHLRQARRPGPYRAGLGCANAAHAYAAMPANDKLVLHAQRQPNLGIITAYNDMLSAHQPYELYPQVLREAARAHGATAQVAGGVPAMCDGITQGEDGMGLSLFSRDVIAMATAVGLSHNVFDAGLLLGICDKIVPGLFMGALQFGHLPMVFVPAGPMTSGLSNSEKARVRQQFTQGLVDRQTLLQAEQAAYHSAGTCTFYGTANSNQMLMEIMGMQLPGSSFVNPGTPLRLALTQAAVQQAVALTQQADSGMGFQTNAQVIVNGMVGLLATGGSTNHSLHLVAMAQAAGLAINWDDFSDLSAAVPLLARVYPNGSADVNHFHAAGGMGFVIRELLDAGLLHDDVHTVMGAGLRRYTQEPFLDGDQLRWRDAPTASADEDVLRPVQRAFSPDGGLRLLTGNLGRAVVKVSAVKPEHREVRAPAVVVDSQQALAQLYKDGQLNRDFVAVVREQGPQANGMPELHKLTPLLGVLQDQGFRVALVTDGRMSGASGKVPAAIHLSPESRNGGMVAKVRDGDMVCLNCNTGVLTLEVSDAELASRPLPERAKDELWQSGQGLFGLFRQHAALAEEGASPLLAAMQALSDTVIEQP